MPKYGKDLSQKTHSESNKSSSDRKIDSSGASSIAACLQKARLDPSSLTHANVYQLHKMIGNRAVQQLIPEIDPANIAQAGRSKIASEFQTDNSTLVDSLHAETAPTPSGSDNIPAQFFRDNLLIGHELENAFNHRHVYNPDYNTWIGDLVNLCNQYKVLENKELDYVIYQRSADQIQTYQSAIGILSQIADLSQYIIATVKETEYEVFLEKIRIIRDCAIDDLNLYDHYQQQAQNEVDNAYNMVFKLDLYENPYAQYPNDYITSHAFITAKNAGILNLQMVKWWHTHNYPGFNAEVNIYVANEFWAIAHIKWDAGKGPFQGEDPSFYHFKTPDGQSFPDEYSRITDSSVQIYLLGECVPYAHDTQIPWGAYEGDRRYV